MATTLLGYGPHTIAANDDYDVACVKGRPGRSKRLVIGLNVTAGNFVIKSRATGGDEDFATQSYTKQDETVAAAAISADATVWVDATGKDIRLTGAGGSAGTLKFQMISEA